MLHNVKRILAPIDFSQPSFEAMRGAWELATELKAELHLLHVVAPHMALVPGESAAESAREAGLVEEAEEELGKIKHDQLENASKVITSAVIGPPVAMICEYCSKNQIDLIMLATRGRTGWGKLLIGSVAEKLTRTAPCSVLILRTLAEHAQTR